uniref:Acidic protein n=1 Tax=Oryza barthii TaxID=65489 RepID=A0A679BBI5_9ORYZ|nr:hypothetical protein [Oryza barthii]BBF89305.1 hypothetical protein [Oryza barthii]
MVSSISLVFFMLILIVAASTFSSCYASTSGQTCHDQGDLTCTDETCKKICGDKLEYYCKPSVSPTRNQQQRKLVLVLFLLHSKIKSMMLTPNHLDEPGWTGTTLQQTEDQQLVRLVCNWHRVRLLSASESRRRARDGNAVTSLFPISFSGRRGPDRSRVHHTAGNRVVTTVIGLTAGVR